MGEFYERDPRKWICAEPHQQGKKVLIETSRFVVGMMTLTSSSQKQQTTMRAEPLSLEPELPPRLLSGEAIMEQYPGIEKDKHQMMVE